LTDRDLRPHTSGGGASVSMVYRACGCEPQCGKCVPFVRQMLRDGTASGPGESGGAD
jgi:bacterioferritin-associated ferredoxin